eukprot:501328_1
MLMVYDMVNSDSFENIKRWNDQIETHQISPMFRILIGNKCDLKTKRVVSIEQAQDLCKQLNITQCVETSEKTGENVDDAFYALAKSIYMYRAKRILTPFYD